MNAAISGVCALVIGALTYTVIAASGREGFEAKLGALLAFALTFGGVHVAREWWFDNADRSATAYAVSTSATVDRETSATTVRLSAGSSTIRPCGRSHQRPPT